MYNESCNYTIGEVNIGCDPIFDRDYFLLSTVLFGIFSILFFINSISLMLKLIEGKKNLQN